MTVPHMIFLLGGYDLEMLTIKQMLEERSDCVVIDKHLKWNNALLSTYAHEIQQNNTLEIYGIELQEDIPTTPLYHRIDHHNDWEKEPSALEQVAMVIGVELNRYQQLIAANDKGYIPAMVAMSATKEEIAEIRLRDRQAQGVTEKDEQLANLSVVENLVQHGDLLVVKSLTPRFSPICDQLFPYHSLLIYTDEEWVFYGIGKTSWVKMLTNEIKQKKVYHGGGDNGYIGAAVHAYSKDAINQFVNQIIERYERI